MAARFDMIGIFVNDLHRMVGFYRVVPFINCPFISDV